MSKSVEIECEYDERDYIEVLVVEDGRLLFTTNNYAVYTTNVKAVMAVRDMLNVWLASKPA